MNSFRKPSRWLGLGLVIAVFTLATLRRGVSTIGVEANVTSAAA